MKFFATAPRGMNQLLGDELRALGAERINVIEAGVWFQGPLETAYRACLWSRIANRVLLPLTTVPAPDAETLYEGVKAIRWERHMRSSGTLAVDCTASDSPISHSRFAALKVKDAVVDRFREQFGERPDVDTDHPDIRINVHLRGPRAQVSLDLAGMGLHRRGYRAEGAMAPLKENLAAAILRLAGWPEIAARGGALVDPMCGSGTLLIEAALMAADIAPGLDRDYFGFLGWRGHDATLWARLLEEARTRREEGLNHLPPIRGFDEAPEALEAARENVLMARLEGRIELIHKSLEDQPSPADLPPGLVATNPPYGERLGESSTLRPLYAALGAQLRPLAGWRAVVFTGNPELAGYLALRPVQSAVLYNGSIECRLFTYDLAARAPGESPWASARPGDGAGGEMLANRLRKNLKNLGRWARREGIDCFRLYDADLPEYAFAVDLYHDPQGQRFVHVQEYEAPKSIDPDKVLRRQQEALAVMPKVLEVPAERLFFKTRRRQKGRAQYEKLAAQGHFHEVREAKARLLVNFEDYLDTGLFLDHRITRGMLGQLAAGRRFLNLFAYTGSATVHAALGGASATTTVDMSNTYLEWARRNLALNGFGGEEHEFIRADCMEWLEREAARRTRRYGLIFLDPPTFSSSKKMAETFDVQRDHVTLISRAAALLEEDGVLIFSNNFRRFKLDTEQLAFLSVEDVTRLTIPEDFKRRPDIHRCWRITRPG